MKKIILGLVLCIISCGLSQSQNLSEYVTNLTNSENVQRQVIDKSMIKVSVETAKAMDPSGKLSEQIPSFMLKLNTIDIIDLSQCAPDIKADFMKRFDSSTGEEGYEILLSADEDNDKVRIFGKTEDSITKELIILAVDTLKEEIVVLKLQGNLDSSDVQKIVDQPNQITG